FTLTYNGQTTAPITWSATTATLQANIQAALNLLPGLAAGAVTVSNAANPTITFFSALAASAQPQITANGAALTAVATTPGGANVYAIATTVRSTVNTYTGGTTINSGTVLLQGSQNLGTDAVTLNGGTMTSNAAFYTLNSEPIAIVLGNTVNVNGPVTLTS